MIKYVKYEGKTFCVGDSVVVRVKNIPHSGLFGTIVDIDGPSCYGCGPANTTIYCDFSLPILDCDKKELVNRFSISYGRDMGISDIPMSHIAMACDEIQVVGNVRARQAALPMSIYSVLTYEGCANHPSSERFYIDIHEARYDFHSSLTDMLTNEWPSRFIDRHKDDECVHIEQGDDFYQITVDQPNNHLRYRIELGAHRMKISSEDVDKIRSLIGAHNSSKKLSDSSNLDNDK